jgi:hypothetical protein
LELNGEGVDVDTWLVDAESSVQFLLDNASSERLVLYASLPHVFVHCVLAPLKQAQVADHAELGRYFVGADAKWRIEHSSGGGKPDRVYLTSPLDDSPTLRGGEKLVYRRWWAGAKGTKTEISQRLVHALDLHYLEARNAYCRLDELGDIEEVIKVLDEPSSRFGEGRLVVTIKASDFYEYARLARMGLVFFYDFTRTRRGSFPGWSNQKLFDHDEPNLFYHGGVQPGVGSYVNGRYIVVPPVTNRQIVRCHRDKWNPKKRSYEVFKAIDLKTGKQIEASCDPDKLSSYFEPNSPLPLQMCPVFFRAEVLHKYKADPEKFELGDRSISCRGAWHLETYDVNDVGQVHTYVRYLGYLPYEEQLYWKSFNEWPKGTISRRAFRTDFLGEWSTDYDALRVVRHKVKRLDELSPDWWNPRGDELASAVHYPVTTSQAEWSEAILALDHLVVEGFQETSLRRLVEALGRVAEERWRSLKLLEEYLIGKGVAAGDAEAAVKNLKRLHDLRTIVKGHAAPLKKAAASDAALRDYETYHAHFESLAAGCDSALTTVMVASGISTT